MTAKMVAGLLLIEVDPTKVRPNAWNPNEMSDEMFAKEIRSIETNGFIDPIKVRETPSGLEIVDGAHRVKAAIELKLARIPAVNLGPIPDDQAKKLTIITNELRGAPEPVKLAALLKELSMTTTTVDLALELPLSSLEIDSLIKSTEEFKWEVAAEELTPNPNARSTPALPGAVKMAFGALKGEVSAKLCAELLAEYHRSSAAVVSTNMETVLADLVARLQTTSASTDARIPPPPEEKPKKEKKGKKTKPEEQVSVHEEETAS